jgi:2-polyprenyl-3-methyl-5-hydroxy-6-metoxy-1,4-benzoquinol methylase
MINQQDAQKLDIIEKVRQQFDSAPYLNKPFEESVTDNPYSLFIHNFVTSYYLRNQKVIDTKGKVILDAGCGSGFKSLMLAEANPGAKIVGVDLSEESVKIAEKRLQYHGFDNVEFHTLLLEDLPKLSIKFDYINCDDVLYLIPDALEGLKAMKSVLKQDGVIRVNFHSALQRASYFQAQELFKFIGLMDKNPGKVEINMVQEIMKGLQNNVKIKAHAWGSSFENNDSSILSNHLLVGDKGSTITEFFALLRNADLEFFSMVNWQKWDLMELFKDLKNLPPFLAIRILKFSDEEKLRLFELLNPIHRLLDVWCGHPQPQKSFVPVSKWTDSDWQNAKVHLHPQLKTPNFCQELIACATDAKILPLSYHLSLIDKDLSIDSGAALCLIPLLEQPQSMAMLVEYWKQMRPLEPMTKKPIEHEQAFNRVKQILMGFVGLGYLMLEQPK